MFFFAVLVTAVSITFYSCDKEENVDMKNSNASKVTTKSDDIEIGTYDGTDFTFTVSESELLQNWNDHLLYIDKIDAQLTSLEFLEIDGKYYLRGRGAEYASTLPLSGTTSIIAVAGIVCTSKTCSTSSTACVPKTETSCTSCWSGDCTKSVSGATGGYSHNYLAKLDPMG